MTNVGRHARATDVEIALVVDGGNVVLTVQDDGSGMQDGCRGGFGLVGIRERVAALGGAFRISASAGTGTSIEVTLPLVASEAPEAPH